MNLFSLTDFVFFSDQAYRDIMDFWDGNVPDFQATVSANFYISTNYSSPFLLLFVLNALLLSAAIKLLMFWMESSRLSTRIIKEKIRLVQTTCRSVACCRRDVT